MRQKPNWPAIKQAYYSGEGSLRELVHKFGVPRRTLERKASAEQWRQERENLGGIVTAAAAETAKEEGRKLGLTASGLVERSIRETEAWLNRVESVATDGKLDADKLGKCVSAWRGVVETGREAFGIGPAGAPAVRLNVLASFSIAPVDEPSLPALPAPSDGGIEGKTPA